MLHKFQFDTCLVFSCDPVYLSQGTDCMYVGIADLGGSRGAVPVYG